MSDTTTKPRRIDHIDAIAAAGLSLLAYGLWLAWPPLGFIGGGGLLLSFAGFAAQRQSAFKKSA